MVIKYLFSVYITFLAFRTTQNELYLVAGLLELVAIILLSNWLLKLNKPMGNILHLVLMFLFNAQMLVLCFASSFTTIVMLANIGFARDLHGKFGDYLKLIIPMFLCLAIPPKEINIKKLPAKTYLIMALVMELGLVNLVGNSYSPIYNVYLLGKAQADYQKLVSVVNGSPGDAMELYRDKIDDGIKRPRSVGENPNIVLVFIEGLSENIISDERNITPNIANLKAESLRFENYYNHTFATLKGLSGQLYSGYQLDNLDVNLLPSMQSILAERGYHTTLINTEPTNKDFTVYLGNMQFDEVITNMDVVDYERAYIHDKESFELLYDTIEQQSQLKEPFFTVIYTFGTHVAQDSPDEVYGDGRDPLLNKFYNMDYYFGEFLNEFKNNSVFDNTILVFTTDHATYMDEDFVATFPTYKRMHAELDQVPFYIYHKGVEKQSFDVEGRNSLCMTPTVLDYLDISVGNYFLGESLFIPKKNEMYCDTVFYDTFYYLTSNHAQINQLPEEYYGQFTDLLKKYFSIRGESYNTAGVKDDFVTATVEEGGKKVTIALKSKEEHDYRSIWFPLWSDLNGGDDTVWYEAKKVGTNEWSCTVELPESSRGNSYTYHVYEGNTQPERQIGAGSVYIP